jgi:predicted  nucleic acid-binding Zn-ribbon protein
MHKVQVDQEQIKERFARLEEMLEQKADRDDLEDCSNELEELREDVGDLQGQLADAESRIDDLESADWT